MNAAQAKKIDQAIALRDRIETESERLLSLARSVNDAVDCVEHYETLSDPGTKKMLWNHLDSAVKDGEAAVIPLALPTGPSLLDQLRNSLETLSDGNCFPIGRDADITVRSMRYFARRTLKETQP